MLIEATSLVAWRKLPRNEHGELSMDMQMFNNLFLVVTCISHLPEHLIVLVYSTTQLKSNLNRFC